jgi:hypothetical protein
MSSTGVPAPRLPTPPNEYVAEYFNQIIRALNNYFVQLQNPGPVQATTINVARFDPQNGARTIGLVFSTNNSSNTTASATTISVDDVTGFNATGGYGMIKEATGTNRKYRKFTYTGKTVATGAGDLTGVVFIAGTSQSYPIHSTVTASALTGDLFYDPFYGYQVYVIQ